MRRGGKKSVPCREGHRKIGLGGIGYQRKILRKRAHETENSDNKVKRTRTTSQEGKNHGPDVLGMGKVRLGESDFHCGAKESGNPTGTHSGNKTVKD